MVGADALVHVHGEVDGLARAHLGDEDVRVDGGDGVLAAEVFNLLALGLEDNVLGVDVRMVVRLERIRLGPRSLLIHSTGHIELQLNGIPVERVRMGILPGLWFLVPLEVVVETFSSALERY